MITPIHLPHNPPPTSESFEAAMSKVRDGALQLEVIAQAGAGQAATQNPEGIREALLRLAEDLK